MLNIGFIGCGGIARNHASRLTHIRGARIVAAADVVADAARGFARDYGAPFHADDYRRILERPELDAVWICTPTHQHPAPVIAAARAGKHVFCEKPMALTMAAARRMKKACDEHGVRLTIGFVRRFDAQWGKLKQIVQSGALGTPVIWRFAAGGRPANPWFRDETKGGGPLMDGAIHNYDYALQIFGPAASVQASSLQFDSTSVGADTASAIINFKSGDQHSLIWSWGVAAGAQVANLNDVIGPLGSLQFGMTAQRAPKSFDPKKHGAFTLKAANGREEVYPFPHRDMFSEQLKHVVRAFAKSEQPLVTGQDGIDALAIASSVLRSGKSRRTVKI
ncbi:MAG: Gfo/Idh/MocA family oxidoreductase [Candidatus Latescibacteria bacterium]|nr:Gfo/Idh/MocA family oxidoreductase [Candidatus Latescibacterota bacterium]